MPHTLPPRAHTPSYPPRSCGGIRAISPWSKQRDRESATTLTLTDEQYISKNVNARDGRNMALRHLEEKSQASVLSSSLHGECTQVHTYLIAGWRLEQTLPLAFLTHVSMLPARDPRAHVPFQDGIPEVVVIFEYEHDD